MIKKILIGVTIYLVIGILVILSIPIEKPNYCPPCASGALCGLCPTSKHVYFSVSELNNPEFWQSVTFWPIDLYKYSQYATYYYEVDVLPVKFPLGPKPYGY